MTSTLLTCKICSKQPKFTDISHLLTHISSKGHLAQLHKLQVKSHQELGAGIDLAAHNQWYQEHGLAQLLSERLRQKEKKQATKRVCRRKTAVKVEPDPIQPQDSPGQQPLRGRGRPRKTQAALNGVQHSAYTVITNYPLTPLGPSSSWQCTPDAVISPQLEIDPSLIATPARLNTNTRLKGKVWPGMALFDAASPEEARRRNQKKDASVVKRMERLSRLVQPAEVTFSSEWSPRKSRHIDDLDDASSLIDGESPLMIKLKPKQKRKALARISSNVVRSGKRKVKVSPSPKRPRRREISKKEVDLPSLGDSVYPGPYSSLFSAAIDGAEDIVRNPLLPFRTDIRPRFADFTTLEDTPLAPQSIKTKEVSLPQSYHGPTPRPSFQTASWLQPQNQNPLFLDTHYMPYKKGGPANTLQHIDDVKDTSRHRPIDHGHLNPLSWPSPKVEEQDPIQSPSSSFGPFSGYIAAMGLPDPFALARNPLADAFAHLSEVGKPGYRTIQS